MNQGYKVLTTREPGGTPLAENIRSLLLNTPQMPTTNEYLTSECEAALVFAARTQHLTHTIIPALTKGMIILCDRFADSTLAYQGFGRKLGLGPLQAFNDFITQGLNPDLTFLFDLPVAQGLARRKRSHDQNRLDHESLAFHQRVRKGFLTLAEQSRNRIQVIDGRQDPDSIASTIEQKFTAFLKRRSFPTTKTPRGRKHTINR